MKSKLHATFFTYVLSIRDTVTLFFVTEPDQTFYSKVNITMMFGNYNIIECVNVISFVVVFNNAESVIYFQI